MNVKKLRELLSQMDDNLIVAFEWDGEYFEVGKVTKKNHADYFSSDKPTIKDPNSVGDILLLFR